MGDDYRNTKYCPTLDNLAEKKQDVKNSILAVHSRAIDMHRYISDNDKSFKQAFVQAYNAKCAYCGVPLENISWNLFEIDHFIPQTDGRFKYKSEAGYIENLVLSCFNCNRAKGDFVIPDKDHYKVHPDGSDVCNTFVRDDDYYIRLSDASLGDASVEAFYERLCLGNQMHRLDYLLMNMRGLRDSLKDKPSAYVLLNQAIELMKSKRR